MPKKWVTVLGTFVADLAFRTPELPVWGQTMMGTAFALGPGGKGSNQAVAAARLGGRVCFITRLGNDEFGQLARRTYQKEGIDTEFCFEARGQSTGAASIVVHERGGENAIVVVPGAGFTLRASEVARAKKRIAGSAVFMTQLEVPLQIAVHGLELAHRAGVTTIFNPAPAQGELPGAVYPLCDYLTPNETEAAALVGSGVSGLNGAERAADALLKKGARNVVITLGKAGAFVKNAKIRAHVPAIDAGRVVETTGAGDAFNAGLAIGLAEGLDLVAATRMGCATAGISVTRPGTAPAMPTRREVDALLKRSR